MLRHDGGAARAIAEAGGPTVAKESDEYIKKYGHLPVGGVAVTSAGKLRAFKIIHALGPMYANGASNEDQLYRLTVRNCLETAEQHSCTSIVFPAISCGIFGYPPQPAANAFFQEIYLYVREIRPKKIRQIRVAISDASTYQVWKQTYDDAIQALQKVSGS